MQVTDITYAHLAVAIEAAGGKVRIPNLTLLHLQANTQIEYGQDPDGVFTMTLIPRRRETRNPDGAEL
jgi:hypothetical protein